MNFDDYQREARKTDLYTDPRDRFLGLAEECGEVISLCHKAYRDHGGRWDADRSRALSKELGDMLWGIGAIAAAAGLSLQDIADENLAKLRDRKARGVLHGSGDER